jgi:hypothetical protein
MTPEQARAAYAQAIEATVGGMDEEAAMVHRHACWLVYERLDVLGLAERIVAGTLPEAELLAAVRPFVREALAAAAPVQPDAKRLH